MIVPALAMLAAAAALGASPARGIPASPAAPIRLEVGPGKIVCGVTAPPGAAYAGAARAAGTTEAAKAAKALGPGTRPSDRTLGLLIWFHGGMRSGNREKGLLAHRQAMAFIDTSRFVLASASAFAGRDWLGEDALRTVDALIDSLQARYPLGDDRILMGVSDGCLGVIRYAAAGRWQADRMLLVSSLPQLAVSEAELRRVPGFRRGRWDFLQGGRDHLFPAATVVPFLEGWARLHPGAHLHYFPEGGHDFAYYATQSADLLRALLAPQTPGHNANTPK